MPPGRYIPFVLPLAVLWLTGCGLGDKTIAEADPELFATPPTYSATIDPILEQSCRPCHGEDSPGGIRMRDYEEVKLHRQAIAEAVRDGSMPPGGAEGLNAVEKELLFRWAENPINKQ